MSNFCCEYCGTSIVEGADGEYITECKHYPKETKRISPIYARNQLLDQMAKENQQWGLYDEIY